MLGVTRSVQPVTQAKNATPVQKSRLVSVSVPVCRRQTAFQPARQAVKARAAEVEPETVAEAAPEAEVAPVAQATPARREKRVQRAVTVELSTISVGDVFEGTVETVETFGAFVNIGSNTNGLVHVSQMADGFVKNPKEICATGDKVEVRVLSVDISKNRLALSMKGLNGNSPQEQYDGGNGAWEKKEDQIEFAEEAEEEVGNSEDEMKTFVEELGRMSEADLELVKAAVEDVESMTPVQSDVPGLEDVVFLMDNSLLDNEDAMEEGFDIEYKDVIPDLALVTGKITNVKDFGVYVEFKVGENVLSGLLPSSYMKAPRGKVAGAEEEIEMYLEVDDIENNVYKYYTVGDEIDVMVDDVNDEGEITLTQFMPNEFEPNDDEEVDEDEFMRSPEEEIAAFEEAEITSGDAVNPTLQAMANLNVNDMKASYGSTGGIIRNKKGQLIPIMNDLPSREVDVEAIRRIQANLSTTVLDIDLDVMDLDDTWSSEFEVPKNFMRETGMRFSKDEAGKMIVIKKEGARVASPRRMELLLNIEGNMEERVNAFLKDIYDEDLEEEEYPLYGKKRPVAYAASVEEVATVSATTVKTLRKLTGAGMMDCKKALVACNSNMDEASEWLRKKGIVGADKKGGRIASEGAIIQYIHPGSRLGVLMEVNCETDFVAASDAFNALINEVAMICAASPDIVCVNPEDMSEELLEAERAVEMGKEDLKSKPEAIRAKVVEGRIEKMRNSRALVNQASLRDTSKTVKDIVTETIATVGENIKIRRYIKWNLGEGLEKKANDFAAEVAAQTAAKAPEPKAAEPVVEAVKEAPKAPLMQVPATLVKQLRNKTGAGMMDCKRALGENAGDIEASIEWLRKKGLSGADKKMGRVAAEGVLCSYIHPGSRLGVLLEVNCETDFVAASDKFQTLVNSIAMQIAASPGVMFVNADEIPAEVFEKEKAIEMGKEDLKSKPEALRAKIAEGRTKKLTVEMCLMEQASLSDGSKTINDMVKEAIAAIGEKISVRRFTRFSLGEGIEKKSNDFAAEVAAATGQTL